MLPGVHGSSEEHDLPVWTRYLSDVWRPDDRVPDLSQVRGEKNPPVLVSEARAVPTSTSS